MNSLASPDEHTNPLFAVRHAEDIVGVGSEPCFLEFPEIEGAVKSEWHRNGAWHVELHIQGVVTYGVFQQMTSALKNRRRDIAE